MKKISLLFLFLILILATAGTLPAQAADYYVSPTGTTTNPGTMAQPWSLAKANTTLKAGDTAYLLSGTYNAYINPSSSGIEGSPITYRNFDTDVVTISGTSYAIYIYGKSYITVTGINATLCRKFLYIKNGNHNIIAHGKFGPQSPLGGWEISVVDSNSQYNWIHHLEFFESGVNLGTAPNGTDEGSVLDIGRENGTDATKLNLIEDNVFYRGGHHVVALHTGYNTFRNNYVHNEAWSNNAGNRTLYLNNLTSTSQPDVGHNVIEGNRFGYAAKPIDAITVGIVAMSTNYNLFRYNSLFHGNAYGLGTSAYGNPNSQGSYNHIYNNTIFNTGLGGLLNGDPNGSTYTSEHSGIQFLSSANQGNALRNNLFYATVRGYRGNTSAQNFANDWDGNVLGNPLFVNASTTPPDPSDITLPNLNLQSNSPAIDKGGPLTTVAAGDSGSGTTLLVTDSAFFQDGSYAPPGKVQPDWIAVGTETNIVQILSINHSANTITLANSISRASNDSVWLYKKSDGVRVLYGSAPDAGAAESAPTGPDTTAPAVSITAPADNSTIWGAITVSANASDNVGVAGVQFRVNGNDFASEDTSAPYSATLDTDSLSDDTHVLTAVARDAAGNTNTSQVTVTVDSTISSDTEPPTVSITAPANNATVSGTITISGTATDNIGVAGVQFRIDGSNLGAEMTTVPYSTSLNTLSLSEGSHVITAVARDLAGNQTTSGSVNVTVDNIQDGCFTGDDSWQSEPITEQTGIFTAAFDATPSAGNIDGVIGLSPNVALAYADLAAIVRFNSSGSIDVRNGAAYTSDISMPYTAGTSYHFRLEVDIPNHFYSVYVTPSGSSEIILAANYAFRTEQNAVSSLNYWAIYDSAGSIVCNFTTSSDPTPPVIISQPTPQSTVVGGFATFSVSAYGNPSPSYQWQKNTVNIPGATGSSYTTPALQLSDSGSQYRVIVSNSEGSTISNSVSLTVTEQPISQPIAVDFLLDGEGSDGSTLTSSLLNAMTKKTSNFPSGSWSVSGNWKIKASGEQHTLSSFSVDENVYADSTGSTGLVLENAGNDHQFVQYTFGGGGFSGDFVFGTWIYVPSRASGDWPCIDLVWFEINSDWAVAQSTHYSGSLPKIAMHTNQSPNRGAEIEFEYDTWYWLTFEARHNKTLRLSMFNTDGTRHGGESSLLMNDNNTWKFVAIGHTDTHGDNNFTGEMRFDDIVMIVNPTDDDYPLGPGIPSPGGDTQAPMAPTGLKVLGIQ